VPKGAAACLGGAGHPPFSFIWQGHFYLDSFATDRVSLFSFGEFLCYQLCHSQYISIDIGFIIFISFPQLTSLFRLGRCLDLTVPHPGHPKALGKILLVFTYGSGCASGTPSAVASGGTGWGCRMV